MSNGKPKLRKGPGHTPESPQEDRAANLYWKEAKLRYGLRFFQVTVAGGVVVASAALLGGETTTVGVTVGLSAAFTLVGGGALAKVLVDGRTKQRLRKQITWLEQRTRQLEDAMTKNGLDYPVPEIPPPSEWNNR
jgi:hypothetical protein